MRNVNAVAYYNHSPKEASAHKTSLFTLNKVDVPLGRIILNQVCFTSSPEVKKNRNIDMNIFDNNNYSSNHKADLIVTDDPSEIINYISYKWIERNFKLDDLITRAEQMFGYTINMWSDVHDLDQQTKSTLFVDPIMKKCQQTRQSEEQMFGYKKLGWEEFSKQYEMITTDDNVFVFPKEKHDVLVLKDRYSKIACTINFGDHNNNGEESVWVQGWNSKESKLLWDQTLVPKIYKKDDILDILESIDSLIYDDGVSISAGQNIIDATEAPSLLKNLKYQQLYMEKSFDLGSIKEFAKEIGIKNFSTKTKAELSIMIGEHLANLPADNLVPSLIINSDTNTRLEDIETLTHEIPAFLKHTSNTIRDYYLFNARVVSGAVYAPFAAGSAAGRTPTDGNFSGYYGIEPLKFLED